ncbi:hypothetical protein LCGC14_1377320, partial [marine sediment metagenome]
TKATTTYTYNSADQLTSDGINTYSYDASGNLISDGTYTYVYDEKDRLIEVKQGPNAIASYSYDASGQRISKTVGGQSTDYVYNDSSLMIYAELSSTNKVFVGSTGGYAQLAYLKIDGNAYYYVYDAIGQIIGLTDTSGKWVVRYSYDSWGNPTEYDDSGITEQPLGTFDNPYLYKNYYYDTETGLYYLNARYYNPRTARFLIRDPDPGEDTHRLSKNAYAYTYNNPIANDDPNGHGIWSSVVNTVSSAVSGAVKAVKRVVRRAVKAVGNAINNHIVKPIVEAVQRGTQEVANWVNNTIVQPGRRAGKAVVSVVSNAVSSAASRAASAAAAAIARVEKAVSKVKATIARAKQKIAKIKKSIGDKIARIKKSITKNYAAYKKWGDKNRARVRSLPGGKSIDNSLMRVSDFYDEKGMFLEVGMGIGGPSMFKGAGKGIGKFGSSNLYNDKEWITIYRMTNRGQEMRRRKQFFRNTDAWFDFDAAKLQAIDEDNPALVYFATEQGGLLEAFADLQNLDEVFTGKIPKYIFEDSMRVMPDPAYKGTPIRWFFMDAGDARNVIKDVRPKGRVVREFEPFDLSTLDPDEVNKLFP